MIIWAYLHGGEARCCVVLVTNGHLVNLRHPPFEGLFFLCGHCCVCLFNIPLLLLCDLILVMIVWWWWIAIWRVTTGQLHQLFPRLTTSFVMLAALLLLSIVSALAAFLLLAFFVATSTSFHFDCSTMKMTNWTMKIPTPCLHWPWKYQ
jgi:hypothetical protein